MALSKQAKTLNQKQIKFVLEYLGNGRNALRNQVVFLLSVKAGLRAKEIANLKWEMVMNSDGSLSNEIGLVNVASKGISGRKIPINRILKAKLAELFVDADYVSSETSNSFVIRTERSNGTSPQVIVNLFSKWYNDLGLVGCSSHSGRRTFITNAARKIAMVNGSLRDVQYLAGHSSLQTTERYIEYSEKARQKLVDII
ncbi:site-specific integrase [Cognatishimia sp. D5M38]|uniref:Site-specific integrase n=1 Tax=Cognatishimia coralii TaxID=3083254 RepID=A0ABU8QI48_9RHOB